jgi:hypothetical protein
MRDQGHDLDLSYCRVHADGITGRSDVIVVTAAPGLAQCPVCRRVVPWLDLPDHFTALGEPCQGEAARA